MSSSQDVWQLAHLSHIERTSQLTYTMQYYRATLFPWPIQCSKPSPIEFCSDCTPLQTKIAKSPTPHVQLFIGQGAWILNHVKENAHCTKGPGFTAITQRMQDWYQHFSWTNWTPTLSKEALRTRQHDLLLVHLTDVEHFYDTKDWDCVAYRMGGSFFTFHTLKLPALQFEWIMMLSSVYYT